MQLNYLGRYRSLYQFHELIKDETSAKANIILGRRGESSWGETIDTFDPSKFLFYNTATPPAADGINAGSLCSDIIVQSFLVSVNAPATTVTGQTTVRYNGQDYYAIPVSKANMQVLDTQGRPFLNLYVSFNFKVADLASAFTFRQIGFHDSTVSSDNYEVFAYENVAPQTVNAGDGLTLRLIFAF